MNGRKEAAKFFAGISASQVLTHVAFAAAGVRFSHFGIDQTPGLIPGRLIFWAIVLILLVYYAWLRR